MRAVQINRFGTSQELELREIETPKPGEGQVLIKVHATSVNPLDIKLREGAVPQLIPDFPMTLQGDVAGTVTSVHPSVSAFKPGDEVYGCVGGLLDMPGALAEYVTCDARLIANKPETLSMREAAALGLVGETVWEALFNKARLNPKHTVLVYGGTGGVGHLAALIAKALGCDVAVTASSDHKATIVREQLKIDRIIDYKKMSVESYRDKFTDGRGFDIVFDSVGGDNLNRAIEACAPDGHIITTLPRGDYDISPAYLKNASIHCIFQPLPLVTGQNREKYQSMLKDIASFVDKHGIKPLIDQTRFGLEDAARAHQLLESGDAIGKVVIDVE